jgi:preprotein translocase subunit SecB
MNQTKELGISIEKIFLVKSEVEFVSNTAERNYNLELIAFSRAIEDNGKKLVVNAAFDLMAGIEKPMFRFTARYVAVYTKTEGDETAWSDFSDGNALSHIVPYLREYVSNVTIRMPIAPLYLRPLNCYALVDAFTARRNNA